uniref:Uncharacterized protein n=1 Tax=Mus spicilegus TaxID=10103 RepID=A0A8C6I9F1_MUSSI
IDVTTISIRTGKFEARFFHLSFEEELGKVKSHSRSINNIVFLPDGRATGAVSKRVTSVSTASIHSESVFKA